MRIGIFSDVHGNLEALDVVLNALKDERVDRYFFVGDLVGYGPNPNECIEKIASVSNLTAAGNHDYASTDQLSTDCFNDYARKAIEWTRSVLSSTSVSILTSLPLILVEEGITLVHATLEAPAEWDYIFGYADARRSFDKLTTPICFIGHSHVPVVYIQDEAGEISIKNITDVSMEANNKYIINVGSVGQPRDGDPRASYGVLDKDEGRFLLKRLPYPVDVVQEKMRQENLPKYLIERLSVGQ